MSVFLLSFFYASFPNAPFNIIGEIDGKRCPSVQQCKLHYVEMLLFLMADCFTLKSVKVHIPSCNFNKITNHYLQKPPWTDCGIKSETVRVS